MESERLNKYLAECGICSRREADKIISSGIITINGRKAVMGDKVCETDLIAIKGKPVKGKKDKVVLAYYKPIGVTCTEKDKFASLTVTDSVKYKTRVTYAGRLDKDSEGLLLLSNDGELIQRIMKGANLHEKEYIVSVKQEVTEEFLSRMEQGIYLKELDITTRKCQTKQIGKYTFQIILTQGVNRQIRRMCETLGFQVTSLKRIRVCNIELGNMKIGEYRELSENERETLYKRAGLVRES